MLKINIFFCKANKLLQSKIDPNKNDPRLFCLNEFNEVIADQYPLFIS
jgi:hypothetical protein